MALPVSFYGETSNDYSNEKARWDVAITTLTAANAVAEAALLATLSTAINAVQLTAPVKKDTVFSRVLNAGAQPSNPLAQRENKWLIRYTGDATFKKFS